MNKLLGTFIVVVFLSFMTVINTFKIKFSSILCNVIVNKFNLRQLIIIHS